MNKHFITELSFKDIEPTFDKYLKLYGRKTPYKFLICIEPKLLEDFRIKTGISSPKRVWLSCPLDIWGLQFEKGEVSAMNQSLTVGGNGDTTVVRVIWKSKSGTVYDIFKDNIPCDDIEVWFENLDVDFVYKYLFPNDPLPFKIKDISFQLEYIALNVNVNVHLFFKPNIKNEIINSIQKIDHYIIVFNSKSEKRNRKEGIIHNWDSTLKEPLHVIYEIDLGSAGINFIKKLLKFLSELNAFEKVVIE